MGGKRYDVRWMIGCAALVTCFLSLFSSCKQEDDVTVIVPARHWVEKTVAVVAPIGDANTKARLERTAAWFLENLNSAQRYDTLAVTLKLEWYDEQAANLTELSTTLANREDIIAVVGPFTSEALAAFAPACQKTLKPLIAPTATSEEIIRRYAVKSSSGITSTKPFLWSLTESDVTFAETMMSAYATMCQYYNYDKVSACLFAPDNTYGQTFTYWAPFFAENYGIELEFNEQYSSDEALVTSLMDARESMYEDDVIALNIGSFCVVENMQQLHAVARKHREVLCSEGFFDEDPDTERNDMYWQFFTWDFPTYFALSELSEEGLAALGDRGVKTLQGYEGFSPYADPTTGFEQCYKQRFGVLPTFRECKFYDGLLLTAFAASYVEHHATATADNSELSILNSQFNDAIIAITNADENSLRAAAWNATAMEIYLNMLENGQLLHFVGASGEIAFDSETYTVAKHTTYVHWRILEGQILHVGYLGDTGSHRLSDSQSAWEFLYDKNRAEQDFEQQTVGAVDIPYAPLTEQYAVLVQGSEGFGNYRHQADVLSVYQLLRANGFPDDHIILVIDKACAADSHNAIRVSEDGPDLLGGTDGLPAAQIDYDNADLTPADVSNILLGIPSDRTPTVLPHDAGQNVLVYWSGHGRSNAHGGADEFAWRNNHSGNGFTAQLLKQTAQQMHDQALYRKMLLVAEPCYGEAVVRSINGIQGVLGMTGASSTEQSWADNWSSTDFIWLCDRFTKNFTECLAANPATSYRELFLYCAEHTIGSHAKLLNSANFGKLTADSPREFVVYQK